MKKVELLSPVGNMETLYYAIHNGADAVYFAGKKFGARKFAQNFDEEEIVKAIKYCHLYGVKVYMTVNTLIFDDELEEVLNYIKKKYHVYLSYLWDKYPLDCVFKNLNGKWFALIMNISQRKTSQ